jgi:hypothetical protein
MRNRILVASLLAASVLTIAPDISAQQTLESYCANAAIESAGATESCLTAVQAVVSGQPRLGLVLAGGSPTFGPGAPGIRLGVLPRASASVRLNVVQVRLPDLLQEQLGQQQQWIRRYGAPVPALTGDLSLGLTDGFTVSPSVAGIGALSLLGSVSYIPFGLFDDDFGNSEIGYGVGGRVHLLRESFLVPAIAASVMWRTLGEVRFGDVCRTGDVPVPGEPAGPGVQAFVCPTGGTVGEFGFDLTNWSTRLVVSKQLLGLGTTGGIGYDRYESGIDFGFRGRSQAPPTEGTLTFRVRDEPLDADRWSVFGGLSYSLLIATIALEAGWQQGSAPISGFRSLQSNFDPRTGQWFGSFGFRLSL